MIISVTKNPDHTYSVEWTVERTDGTLTYGVDVAGRTAEAAVFAGLPALDAIEFARLVEGDA